MNRKNILLLVDDDKDFTSSNARLLEREGYEVHTALTLAEAKKQLAVKDPDLILLDVMMTDGNGILFSEEIKRKTSAFILFLTNKKGSKDIVRGYSAGGNDYITKPYDMGLLLQRIAAGLETRAKFMARQAPSALHSNIHSGKYASAPLPELCAPRDELVARLDWAARCRLVFICAPAGSGKTVSANLWAKNSRRKTIWIGLDVFDNSTAVFYRMFCMGILSAQPDNERMSAVLKDPAFDSSPVEHTINFIAEFLTDGNEYVLALDDFHTITNNEILKSLPYMLRRMPLSFATLILSRTEPNAHFDDFIERGQVEVVTGETLAFGKNEIKEYFSMLGRQMSEGDTQTISTYTGGWAIGVSALAQSTAPITGLREHGGQILGNYIGKHLWREWDEALREFMLALAVLDEMPVPLCVEITGRADAEEILESLRMRNAFVSRIEDGVYRFHHLFLDFLREQPEYVQADKGGRLRAAAEYCLSVDNIVSAQRYAYQGDDIEIILKVFSADAKSKKHCLHEFLTFERELFLTRSMEALCEKCPVLYMPRMYVALLVGNAGVYEDAADKLKHNMPLILREYAPFGEIAAATISGTDYRVPFAKLVDEHPADMQGAEIDLGYITFQLPFLHRSGRDFYELSDPALRNRMEKYWKMMFSEHYEPAMLCIAGGFLLEQNDLNAALEKARDAAAQITPRMASELRFAAYMQLAAAYLALNKSDELTETLREAEMFIDSEARFLHPGFLAFTSRLKLWDNDMAAAKEWLAHYFVNDNKTLELYRIYQYFTTARAYAVLGELEKATDLAIRLRKLSKDFIRPQDAAEAGALLAAILWAEGKKDEAQEILETVLLELQPYKFIRLVADEGAAIAPIVKKISAKCERSDYTGELNPIYVKNVYLAAFAVSKQRRGIMANLKAKPVKLSKKQKLVIELMAQGHNMKSIMEKTGMALGTFKTHIRLAYEKLEVNNVTDAVLKARELGIIE